MTTKPEIDYEKTVKDLFNEQTRIKKEVRNSKIRYFQSLVDEEKIAIKLEVACRMANVQREKQRKLQAKKK